MTDLSRPGEDLIEAGVADLSRGISSIEALLVSIGAPRLRRIGIEVPPSIPLFRAIPRLKEELQINVELASPEQFIPELPGWKERSPFIERDGRVSFYHYDLYAQALAKIERGHDQDLADVREMLGRGLIEAPRLRRFFESIEPRLYRYPAVDAKSFRNAVEEILEEPPRA